jgi:hypothetical protein
MLRRTASRRARSALEIGCAARTILSIARVVADAAVIGFSAFRFCDGYNADETRAVCESAEFTTMLLSLPSFNSGGEDTGIVSGRAGTRRIGFATNLSSAIALSTRVVVAGLRRLVLLITCETVAAETPAMRATSYIVFIKLPFLLENGILLLKG